MLFFLILTMLPNFYLAKTAKKLAQLQNVRLCVVKASWKIVSVKDNEQREIAIFDCEILVGENK